MPRKDEKKPDRQENPFGDEAPTAAPADDGGLLGDLRDVGEAAVSEEIAGLQAAIDRVEHLGETIRDADFNALKEEWQQIQSDIKRALQSGMAAVEETRARRPAGVEDDVRSLEGELGRKNELIAQLSETLRRSARDVDEKDRRLREELRDLRERASELDDEVEALRTQLLHVEERAVAAQGERDAASAERDALVLEVSHSADNLRSERTLHEERYAALQEELNEARLGASQLENVRRDLERRAADLEKRLEAGDKARARAETERGQQAQEASRARKDAETLGDKVATLERELATRRERADKEIKRLRRSEGRFRADSDSCRARVEEALEALKQGTAALEGIPQPPRAEEPEEPAPDVS